MKKTFVLTVECATAGQLAAALMFASECVVDDVHFYDYMEVDQQDEQLSDPDDTVSTLQRTE